MYSFSQNFEDVMLARLFPGVDNGFYVDVGAADPVELSVTKHFYDAGWRGINIEPILSQHRKFLALRPFDINLNCAIGSSNSTASFLEVVDNTALSTLAPERSFELRELGHEVRTYDVPVRPLNAVLHEFADSREIDFLKIDVEGGEEDVLSSLDLQRWRPRIVVIEAVRPMEQFPGWEMFDWSENGTWNIWENRFLEAGYEFVYFDGLNRFYARPDMVERCQRLRIPPGVFDFIVPSFLATSSERTQLALTKEAVDRHIASLLVPLASMVIEKEAVIKEQKAYIDAFEQAGIDIKAASIPVEREEHRGLSQRIADRVFPRRLGILKQHTPCPIRLPVHYETATSLTAVPKISVVIPSYNQGSFLPRTLDSLLNQDYPALEIFVQDGGSTDDTAAVLKSYDGRISGWVSETDSGQSDAIDKGFTRTSGEIMGWLNSDDILLPGSLHYVAQYFNENPDVDVVYGHRLLIDADDQMIGRWIMPPHQDEILSWADYVPQETMFWRRQIWEKAGGRIDTSFRFAMDWDLLLRFREAAAKFVRLPRFIGGFRVHDRQKTSTIISDVGMEEMDRLRERALGRVPEPSEVYRAVAPYLMRHVVSDFGWRLRNRLRGRQ